MEDDQIGNPEDAEPEDIFDDESYESIEKAPRVYKLWHLIVAFLVGGSVVAGVFLVPSFGGQGFIGGELPSVEKISDRDNFSSFTGALTPELNNFSSELTPELGNNDDDELKLILESPSKSDVVEIDKSFLEKAELEKYKNEIEGARIPEPKPINNVKIIEETLPLSDFEDFSRYIEPTEITNPVSDITNPVSDITNPVSDITNPVSDITNPVNDITNPVNDITNPVSDITNPVSDITNPVSDKPVIEYKNIPIPTNYTIKTIE